MTRVHDETSEALLRAAHTLLTEQGAEALTVRRIAGEAGMSTMNVYSRFGGKDGVIDELYLDGYRRMIDAIDSIPETDDVIDDLMRRSVALRKFAIENPTYYAVMFRSAVPGFEPSPESREFAYTALARTAQRVERGQAIGVIAVVDDCNPGEIAASLFATCHGLISLEIDGVAAATVSWPNVFDFGIRTALAGLHPSVAPAKR
ncbi:MAG: TetR/AcrR family transcriptional regulator [Ilumatobacter sp.]|uniref:TetR/AcrR family transcriptional regulator n=1 Tax=Ilumatobacter sp. TaxID=1967498 RepID=UPI002626E6AD|nr:TetR/AcrR family transcriptional regulator [Ilumatobacter sp.]MDJ0770050.1 TetR/AcrR family transcriptional regulator [Ilumatobacter sp.]